MKTKPSYFHFLGAILSILLSSSASAQLTKLNLGYSAISAFGTVSNFVARYALEKIDLIPCLS